MLCDGLLAYDILAEFVSWIPVQVYFMKSLEQQACQPMTNFLIHVEFVEFVPSKEVSLPFAPVKTFVRFC